MTAARPCTTPWRRLLAATTFVLVTGLTASVGLAADETRDFPDANVRWTLPDDEWTWMEPSADDKATGVFAQAASGDSHIHAFAMTTPTGGLPLADRVDELARTFRPWVSGGMIGTKTIDTVLAGRDAQCVIYVGADANENDIQVRAYAMESDGKFYHVIMRIFHGDEATRGDELNALRDGFHLIKGGGTQLTVETFVEVPRDGGGAAGGAEKGEAAPTKKDDGAAEGEPWPEKGPPREGNKVTFTGYNLSWALPDDGPFSWRSPIRDLANVFQRTERGVSMSPAIRVVAQLERVKGEFDPEDAPKHNTLMGVLFMAEMPGQHDSDKWIRSPEFERELMADYGFTSFNSSKSRTQGIPLGNHKGVMAVREGERQNGTSAVIVHIEATLRGWIYRWYFLIEGYEGDRFKQFQPFLNGLFGGIHFLENTEFVPGPLIGTDGIATFSGKRGTAKDEEKKYEISGFSWTAPSNRSRGGYTPTDGWVFKKPPGLAEIHQGERGLQLALETRSEDGQSYIYYSIWAEATARLQNEKREPEMIIDDHAKSWLSTLGDGAKCSKSGKAPFFRPGSYEGEKGLKYEFTATVDGVPYTEEGYVIDRKQTTYWVRIQLGGKDAEKALKSELKAIQKGFTWAR